MSDLKLKGAIIAIMDKQQVTDSFAKREFVIETDEQYPQQVKFELMNAKCDDIDGYKLGDEATVHFNVRGRAWKNKQGEDVYFVSLNAWRLEKGEEGATQPVEPPVDEDTDIPF
jgi:hypothetical protein